MGLQPLTIHDLKFPEGKLPEIALWDWGSALRQYVVEVLTRHGMEQKAFYTSLDRSMTSRTFRLSDLPMMVGVRPGSTFIRRGEVYVTAFLRLGGTRSFPLLCGYLSDNRHLTWPPGVFESSVEGPGLLRSITGTDPAAGAEISETVPTNARWRVHSMTFTLVTDATVASRRVYLYIGDGVNVLERIACPETQAASLTWAYSASRRSIAQPTALNMPMLSIPPDLMLFQGWRLETSTIPLQAGDNFGAPRLLVEEWIEE